MKVTSGGVWRRGVGAVERSGIGCGAVEGLGRVRRVGMGDKCVCVCVCVRGVCVFRYTSLECHQC